MRFCQLLWLIDVNFDDLPRFLVDFYGVENKFEYCQR